MVSEKIPGYSGRFRRPLAPSATGGSPRRGFRFSPVAFDDLHFDHRPYEPFAAYGRSRTAKALFAVEPDRRGRAEDVRAIAVHPGTIVDTGLAEHVPEDVSGRPEPWTTRAAPYCENCDISPPAAEGDEAAWRAGAATVGVLAYAADPEAAARPCEVSERLPA